jgi:ferredoxin-NADP reductase
MFATLPGEVTLIYRASRPEDIVFGPELDAIARDRGAAVHYLIGSRAEFGGDPLTADRILSLVPGVHRYDVYVCGPGGMTESAIAALTAARVPRRQIHHESFEF